MVHAHDWNVQILITRSSTHWCQNQIFVKNPDFFIHHLHSMPLLILITASRLDHRSLTWWLIDVCGSLAILLAVHLVRTTIEPLQRVSDKYRPTGSDQQEDLATLGSVQLRQTLALWTLASRLPGERPLLETNGDILWTQQHSSGVRSERRKRNRLDRGIQSATEMLPLKRGACCTQL